jgi:Transposase family tnp2
VLPILTYKVMKLLCPLSMEVQKNHVCPNDCILFRNEYKDLDKCPKCNASWYKLRDDPTDEEGKKRLVAKILWYLPVIPRFKRLFTNPKDAKLTRWNAEGRKRDGKLRHLADSLEWRNIDKHFKDFSFDPRNLRLGLSTDEMNPYGIMSTNRSTWSILLVLYNLPSWLCMKKKI